MVKLAPKHWFRNWNIIEQQHLMNNFVKNVSTMGYNSNAGLVDNFEIAKHKPRNKHYYYYYDYYYH